MQSLWAVLEHLGTFSLNRVMLTQEDPHEFELPTRRHRFEGTRSPCWAWNPTGLL